MLDIAYNICPIQIVSTKGNFPSINAREKNIAFCQDMTAVSYISKSGKNILLVSPLHKDDSTDVENQKSLYSTTKQKVVKT